MTDKQNQKTWKNIDIGFAADLEVKSLLSEKQVSERSVLGFRTDCRNMLIKIITKLQEKSPLEYALLKNMYCLDPSEIIRNHKSCKKRFKRVREKLQALGHVDVNG